MNQLPINQYWIRTREQCLDAHLNALEAFHEANKDVEPFVQGAFDPKKPHVRRAAMRAAFASIEAACEALRNLMAVAAFSRPLAFTIPEIYFLLNKQWRLNKNGVLGEGSFLMGSLAQKFAFVVAMAQRVYPDVVDTESAEWRQMKSLVSKRAGVTHPTHPDDLQVSDRQISAMGGFHGWWLDLLTSLTERILRAVTVQGVEIDSQRSDLLTCVRRARRQPARRV